MAGAFRAVVRGTNGQVGTPQGGTITLAIPAAVQVGDVMLAFLQQRETSSEVTTAPAGWTKLNAQVGPGGGVIALWGKRAVTGDAGSSVTFTGTNAADFKAVVAAYSGVLVTGTAGLGVVAGGQASASATSVTVPATTYGTAIGLAVYGTTQNGDAAPNSLNTTNVRSGDDTNLIVGDEPERPSPSLARTFDTGATTTSKTLIVTVLATDVAPAAPTNLVPNTAQALDRTSVQRFAWQASAQSSYDLRYRLVGAPTWTTVTAQTPNQFRDFAANTFAAGDYEWQVRTYSDQGAVGAWSSSAFFTAATPPAGPVITAPLNNATVAATAPLSWSFPAQTAYQVRKVGDSASIPGAPDTTVVLFDSGVVSGQVGAGTRTVPLTFPVNMRFEHLQVRVQDTATGLWSPYSSVRVQVSFTPPALPLLTVTAVPLDAAIDVAVALAPANMLTSDQASFETSVGGWQTQGNVANTRSTLQSLDGAASLAMTSGAPGDMASRTTAGTAGVPIVAGQVYTATAAFRAATAARNVHVRIFWYSAAGTLLTTPQGATMGDNTVGWVRGTVTAQAPADAAFAAVAVYVLATGAANEVHYVDAVGLFLDPTGNLVANPDFDSSTVGYVAPGTLTVDTSRAYTGRSSARNDNGNTQTQGYVNVDTTPGMTYTLALSLTGTVGGLAHARVASSAGTAIASGPDLTLTADWQRTSVTFTATTSVTRVGWRARNTATPTIYVDAVQVVVGSAVALPAYLPPETTNFVRNPSFETDTASWVGENAAISRTTAKAAVGTASLAAVGPANGSKRVSSPADIYSVVAGSAYTFGFSALSDVTGRAYSARIVWFTAAGTVSTVTPTADGPVTALSTTAWTRHTASGTAPSDAAFARLDMNSDNTSLAGETTYLDAVQFEAGSVATPYVDGSVGAGHRWDVSESLLPNGSFETDLTGWAATDATAVRSTAQAFDGTASALVTSTAATSSRFNSTPNIPVAGGVIVTASTYLRAVSTAAPHTLRLVFFNAAGTNIGAPISPAVTPTATGWTRLTFTTTAPDTAVGVRVDILGMSTAVGVGTYIDAVQLEQRAYPTRYANAGTPHASSSTRGYPWLITPSALSHLDIYRREMAVGGDGIRIAKEQPVGVYRDRTPASAVEYEYQIVSVGTNGSAAPSGWMA